MNNNVLVIGIDSMDSQLLMNYIDNLPNFKKLIKTSSKLKMFSVFPPDSDTAWASIYTGLNPAKHGVVDFVDPLEKVINIQTKETNVEFLRGKTFWDIAGKFNKKVYALLPHICYPPWHINGIMVSRSKIKDSVFSIPKIKTEKYDLNILNTPKGVPKKDEKSLGSFIQKYKNLVLNENEFFLKMINDKEWNLFFVYSSALDAIQHYFWNYCDENDIEYPGENPFKNVIKDFYILYDLMVGKLINAVKSKDTTIIILSDHGHGRRPFKILNINEILRRNGYLSVNNSFAINSIERMKIKISHWISKYNLGWMISKLLKSFQQSKNLYSRPLSINWNSTIAYTTDLSGIKAYTYGGIKINKENLKNENEYNITRDRLVQSLSNIKDEVSNKKIVRWVKTREELYYGKEITKFPDILIQLEENFGVGHRVNSPVIDKTYTSSVVPGSHKGDTPIFFMTNYDKVIEKDTITLMDIAPTILDILDIDWHRFDYDGRSIFNKL